MLPLKLFKKPQPASSEEAATTVKPTEEVSQPSVADPPSAPNQAIRPEPKARRNIRRMNHQCQYCGKAYFATRSDAKYCSPACRQAAYVRHRNLENRPSTPLNKWHEFLGGFIPDLRKVEGRMVSIAFLLNLYYQIAVAWDIVKDLIPASECPPDLFVEDVIQYIFDVYRDGKDAGKQVVFFELPPHIDRWASAWYGITKYAGNRQPSQ